IAKLYNKKKKSHIALKADFFVPGDVQVGSLTEEIRNDIKQNVEHFTDLLVSKLEVKVRDQKASGQRVLYGMVIMTNNNNEQLQDSTQEVVDFFKTFKWRIIGFLAFLIIAILFLTLGFWSTILIIVLCLIGIGIGYTKDRKQDFLNFLNRWS